MQIQALPGFRDFYPADLALRTHIFDAWRRVASSYGFEEYDAPPLEPLELYTAKSGAEIVGQLYEFVDKGDRRVALRPEMTPSLARMVAARIKGLRKPIRWFSIPQLFRYERQQRGRLREHFQLNCDLIGEPGPLADAEVIAVAIDVMRVLGLGPDDVRVRVSDRRLLEALLTSVGVPHGAFDATFAVVDKIERTPREVLTGQLATAGLPPAAVEGVFRIAAMRSWTAVEDALGTATAAAPLRDTIAALEAMGLADFVDLDLSIVRGLAYYTGTVFELFDAKGTMRAICGGGRYDDLLAALGGGDVPALGFGMGDVVLGELLKDRGLAPDAPASIDVFVVGVTPADVPHILRLAHRLRDDGLRVEYALGEAAVGRQLKLANARGAGYAVLIGPDDRARGAVQVKDLTSGDQRSVMLGEVAAVLAAGSGGGPDSP